MKFLVLGCNGMAGHMISLYLKEQGHDVTGYARKKSSLVHSYIGDVHDLTGLQEVINNGRYDTIINCIGILNQYAEDDKSEAVFLNSLLPHYLSKYTMNMDTQVIHMSTDCVFSGKKGEYIESDFKDGETFYDRSKALGELEDDKNLTLRNSIVGPDINSNGIGLLNWFLKKNPNTEETINGYVKSIWTGQTTLQLAKTMEAAAMTKATGLYNAVPNQSINKFELLGLFNKYFRNSKLTILPVDGVKADKSLKRTKFDFDYIIPDYEVMVKELADWMSKHKSLYPHYNLDI